MQYDTAPSQTNGRDRSVAAKSPVVIAVALVIVPLTFVIVPVTFVIPAKALGHAHM